MAEGHRNNKVIRIRKSKKGRRYYDKKRTKKQTNYVQSVAQTTKD